MDVDVDVEFDVDVDVDANTMRLCAIVLMEAPWGRRSGRVILWLPALQLVHCWQDVTISQYRCVFLLHYHNIVVFFC